LPQQPPGKVSLPHASGPVFVPIMYCVFGEKIDRRRERDVTVSGDPIIDERVRGAGPPQFPIRRALGWSLLQGQPQKLPRHPPHGSHSGHSRLRRSSRACVTGLPRRANSEASPNSQGHSPNQSIPTERCRLCPQERESRRGRRNRKRQSTPSGEDLRDMAKTSQAFFVETSCRTKSIPSINRTSRYDTGMSAICQAFDAGFLKRIIKCLFWVGSHSGAKAFFARQIEGKSRFAGHSLARFPRPSLGGRKPRRQREKRVR